MWLVWVPCTADTQQNRLCVCSTILCKCDTAALVQLVNYQAYKSWQDVVEMNSTRQGDCKIIWNSIAAHACNRHACIRTTAQTIQWNKVDANSGL